MEKVIQELKRRLNNFNSEPIIKSVKKARGLVEILIVTIIIGLFYCFLFYIISSISLQSRIKLSEQECAKQLSFWISDKSRVGILETKAGFEPELIQNSDLYFWIKAKRTAKECTKNVSFIIFNNKGNIVFKSNYLVPGPLVEAIKNGDALAELTDYSVVEKKDLYLQKGDYVMKINYGNVLAQEINFSVK